MVVSNSESVQKYIIHNKAITAKNLIRVLTLACTNIEQNYHEIYSSQFIQHIELTLMTTVHYDIQMAAILDYDMVKN